MRDSVAHPRWKNITLLTADILSMAGLVAAAILLFVGRL